jgi:hypothetical protein
MVTINKTGKGTARVEVNGKTFAARLDVATRKWVVTTPTGDLFTNSPKMHSIGGLFGQPAPSKANGGAAHPRTPRSPRTPRPKRGQAFATPKQSPREMKLAAVSALEDCFVTQLRDKGVTPEARTAYDKYKKLLAVALGPISNTAMQNEADAALRMAAISLIKVTF